MLVETTSFGSGKEPGTDSEIKARISLKRLSMGLPDSSEFQMKSATPSAENLGPNSLARERMRRERSGSVTVSTALRNVADSYGQTAPIPSFSTNFAAAVSG